MPELNSFFAEVSALVNAELEWLIPSAGRPPQSLRDAIRWSLFSGGKHLRPAIVFAFGRAFGAPDDKLVRTACAVEMIHTYSLIHDDLPSMDDDDLRRGRETCHKKFGEASAILAGDALQTLAFRTIAEDEQLDVATRIALISELARAAGTPEGMVAGQGLDMEAEARQVNARQLEEIHRHQTA